MTEYVCPCCKVPLQCVGFVHLLGDAFGSSVDLHFECMTCAHLISIVINVPDGSFIPDKQMWNYKPGGLR